jgi:hypothetical protein
MKTSYLNLLDDDQKHILMVYSLYTDEVNLSYLQYTAACALIFYLSKEGFFKYNQEELLVYDYLESRLYIWESKKFMTDINILRDHGFLIRARCKSKNTRDVNTHQCSEEGREYLNHVLKNSKNTFEIFNSMKNVLSCENNHLKKIRLQEDGPYLDCGTHKYLINGFIKDFNQPNASRKIKKREYSPFFL